MQPKYPDLEEVYPDAIGNLLRLFLDTNDF